MKIATLARYLIGSRDAILEVAANRWSPLIGAIFVLSAGFAREYDGEDLIHEPWHILRPLGASLFTGSVLFLLAFASASRRKHKGTGTPPQFRTAYRSFIGLFWMTAPLAWLYAIPYERFLSPIDAVSINLWTLGIVAAWRVLLITRVIQVIYGIHFVAAFFIVMLFSDALAFTAMMVIPRPIIDLMGGLHDLERDAIVANATLSIIVWSVLTAPIWILGAMIAACKLKPHWPDLAKYSQAKPSRAVFIAACASNLVFLPLLFLTQPQQINRRTAERLLNSGQIAEGLAYMSARDRSDFPPHWDAPPKLGYPNPRPDLALICEAMANEWPSDWVAENYLSEIRDEVESSWGLHMYKSWVGVAGDYRPRSYERHAEELEMLKLMAQHDDTLSEDDRAAVKRIIKLNEPEMSEGPLGSDKAQMPEPDSP